MTFAEKLDELRYQKTMSQLELSFKAKIPRQIVYRYCAGKKEPLFYDVVKICEALDVDIKEFAGTTFKRPEKKEGAKNRDVLEKVSEEIALAKRNIKSENREYLTGYLAALSGVEGMIAEVRNKK